MSSHRHSRVEANNVDPDEGKSWLCSACKLPIFATPFVGGGAAVLHDECSDLPEELKQNELHREKPMLLVDNEQSATCSQCSQKCGSKMYHCPDPDCGLILDVACALPIKILHWSHPHRLQPIRGGNSSFNICGVCRATHQAGAEEAATTSYFCGVCGFWIHPECAALPSVIEHERHEHPLVLYYDFQATFGADSSITLSRDDYYHKIMGSAMHPLKDERCFCAICGNDVARRCGIYSCITCRNYHIHVKCATSHPRTFKSVSIGEARFPNLVHLPMKDEHQSFVRYAGSEAKDQNSPSVKQIHMAMLHGNSKAPWNYHEDCQDITRSDDDDQDPSHHRVCDACNKIINTPPFHSCSLCSNFFLHDYCNSLPTVLSTISAHTRDHIFVYVPWVDDESFICSHCRCQYNGAFYMCMHERCKKARFYLDVSCVLMPGVITHAVHNAAHFLRLTDEASSSSSRDRGCDCCCRPLGKLCYECRTCPNFALHTWCAMLPRTVTHKFDKHPLILTTTTTSTAAAAAAEMMMICEICENGMESDGAWYYSCSECDQSFHVDCIPRLDFMYKIKSRANSNQGERTLISRLIHSEIDPFHVPTRLIRGLTLEGHGHDYCAHVADEYDILASY